MVERLDAAATKQYQELFKRYMNYSQFAPRRPLEEDRIAEGVG